MKYRPRFDALNVSAIGIVLFINFLFTAKYSSRVFAYPFFAAGVHSLILLLVLYWVVKCKPSFFSKDRLAVLLIIYLLSFSVAFIFLPKEILRVDRWWMIQTFLDNLIDGVYPYTPRPDSNIPSPLPVYYFMLFPFYVIGEVGVATLISLAVFAALLFKEGDTAESAIIPLFFILGSSTMAWEIITRSTVFFNMIMVLLFFSYFQKNYNKGIKSIIFAGILGGLVLSTRSVVAFPLMILFNYYFVQEHKFKESFLAGCALVLTFMITLLPFYFWDASLFFVYNPLFVQSGFVPPSVVVFLALGAAILSFGVKTPSQLYFVSGLILFLAVLVSFGMKIVEVDFYPALFEDRFDISYFIFCLPFFLYYLNRNLLRAAG
jgi:hypothetical protein